MNNLQPISTYPIYDECNAPQQYVEPYRRRLQKQNSSPIQRIHIPVATIFVNIFLIALDFVFMSAAAAFIDNIDRESINLNDWERSSVRV